MLHQIEPALAARLADEVGAARQQLRHRMTEAAHQRAVNEESVGYHEVFLHVIASEAKQSTKPRRKLDCFASLAMTKGNEPILSRHDFIADDEEFDHIHSPKTRGQRHVGGVASGADQDAAEP